MHDLEFNPLNHKVYEIARSEFTTGTVLMDVRCIRSYFQSTSISESSLNDDSDGDNANIAMYTFLAAKKTTLRRKRSIHVRKYKEGLE